jgi:hypothetical protein
MTKLCPRGKAAAKRKFAVYPSAYANAYASKICAGKIKDPSGVKRKDFKGPKPAGKAMGGRIRKVDGGEIPGRDITKISEKERLKRINERKARDKKREMMRGASGFVPVINEASYLRRFKTNSKGGKKRRPTKFKAMGGRIMYGKGGGVCLRGMNREAVGKNS